MSFLRSTTTLFRATTLRPVATAPGRARVQARFFAAGYGDGEGDPKATQPKDQGDNLRSDLEHPGPPPPKVGQSKGASSKDQSSSSETSQSQSKSPSKEKSSSSSSKQKSQTASNGSWQKPKDVKNAKPKILNEMPPDEESDSTRQHNEEMDHRADRASAGISNEEAKKDKVGKGYWSGQGGRDRDA